MLDQIQLQPISVLNVPFQKYEKDFTFIVNENEFTTTKFIADMLSPTISKQHLIDPTIDLFTIKTKSSGNFQLILDLINFQIHEIPEQEKMFICEILDNLDNKMIKITQEESEITLNNVFGNIILHEQYQNYFSEFYSKEVDFISEHFYEINEFQEEQLLNLSNYTIDKIISNSKLQLDTEDQLFKFINKLYSKDRKNSTFFEYVDFLNASEKVISHFLSIFEIDDINNEIWKNISFRLKKEIVKNEENSRHKTKKKKIEKQKQMGKKILHQNKEFDGIFNYLKSKGNISDDLNITSSTILRNDQQFSPLNALEYNSDKYFMTENVAGSWICFDFKKHKVIPTNYTIKSYENTRDQHPRSWVIEGLNVKTNKWEIIDEKNDCSILNGNGIIHTFQIQNQEENEFKSIKMRQTGPNWTNNNSFLINSFELYGELI